MVCLTRALAIGELLKRLARHLPNFGVAAAGLYRSLSAQYYFSYQIWRYRSAITMRLHPSTAVLMLLFLGSCGTSGQEAYDLADEAQTTAINAKTECDALRSRVAKIESRLGI